MDATDNRRLIITKMVLENFKSYAGVQEIGPFHKRFSSIVGPNGSGKSNVIDAMLFVFGKRAKQLRLNKVSELIHKSANYPNLEYARVSVHFALIQDNASEDDFTIIEGSEMTITRTAFNNNQSKYSIDGKTSTYTEVGELLRGFGVDLDNNRFLILQGEVEQIAMMKPKAPNPNEDGLLEYLEDIIGSNKFVEQINESTKALEMLNEQRLDKINRVKFAERERDNLSGAKTEVESLLDKEREIRRQRNVLYQVNEFVALENKAKLDEKLQSFNDKLASEKSKLGDREIRLKDIEVEYERSRIEYNAVDKELDAVTTRFSEFERRDVKIQEDVKFTKEKFKKIQKDHQKELEKETASMAAAEKVDMDYQEALKHKEDFEKKKAEEDAKMEEIMANLQASTQQLREKLEGTQKELAENERTISVFQTEKDSIITKMELVKSRSQHVADNLKTVEVKLLKLRDSKASTHATGVEKDQQYQAATREVEQLENQIKLLNAQEIDLQSKVRQQITDTEEARSAMAAAKSNAPNAVVAAVLKASRNGGPLSMCGVHGRLGDLASIDQEYDVAISTSCTLLDFIVVDTTEGAQKCMNFLRDNNVGRSSFIALDQMAEWSSRMERPFATPAETKRLFDIVIPSGPQIRPALYLALKDTLVADNLDSAVRIAYVGDRAVHRIVTKSGELIDASGSMTGGGKQTKSGLMKTHTGASASSRSASSSGGNLLAASEEEVTQSMVDKLEIQLKNFQSELTSVRRNRDECQARVSVLKKQIKTLTNDLEKLTVAMKSFEEQEAQYMAQHQQLSTETGISRQEQDELAQLTQLIATIDQQMQSAAPQYQSLKQAVAKIQRDIMDVGGPSLARAKQRLDMINAQLEKASSTVSTLQVDQGTLQKHIQKCVVSREKNEKEMTKLKEKLDSLEVERQQMEVEALEVIQAVNEKKALMQAKDESLKELAHAYESLKAEVAKLKSGEVDLALEIEKASKEVKEYSLAASSWRMKIAAVRKQHDDEYAEWAAAFESAAKGFEQTQLQAAGSMECSMPSILKMIPPVTLKDSDILPDLNQQQLINAKNEADLLNREINALEAEKDRLKGNVNMNALIDYMKKDANYRFRLAELEEITMQRNTLRVTYEELRRQRLECFMAGFSIISLKLKEMYQMITLGGDAELELVDSLDPFSEGIVFSVRPPKKSWKNISNLSGGEKTLSSLALVFALHHFKPTPLYVMDEIDAALDFKNVSIVANYIKERTKNAQFVIISLRNNMFELADRLVGIYKTNDATKSVTINPKKFQNVGNSSASTSSAATTATASAVPVVPKMASSDMAVSDAQPRSILADATNRI